MLEILVMSLASRMYLYWVVCCVDNNSVSRRVDACVACTMTIVGDVGSDVGSFHLTSHIPANTADGEIPSSDFDIPFFKNKLIRERLASLAGDA